MGLAETLNRTLFNLTYNEQASKAYDEENQKAAGAVEELKSQIDGYRKKRDNIISSGQSTDYLSTNSINRITEWENWLEKNGGLASGDYTKKSTEMKTQWESLLNVNKIVKEMERIVPFLDLFLKDNETKIPTAQKKEIDNLKVDADKYYKTIVKESPPDIVAKRDEFNRRFEDIQKKIPENFEDLKEPYQNQSATPNNLLQGIQEEPFNKYKNSVEKKEEADESTFSFSRLANRVMSYFSQGFYTAWPYFFGVVFAMIVANDAIGRPVPYRLFYAFFMFLLFQVSIIPMFPLIVFVYYLYRAFLAINWSNIFSLNPTGPRFDFMKAPVLFAFLPIFAGGPKEEVPWYISIFKYDVNRYGGVAEKKRIAYEMNAAKLVGKTLNPQSLNMDEMAFGEVITNMKSILAGTPGDTFKQVVDNLKTLV